MKATIVLTAFNRHDNIFACSLYSILMEVRLSCPECEIIVVDDGSDHYDTKGIVEMMQSRFVTLDIKYVYNNNPGFTSPVFANNIGIQNAKHDIIILSGSDIYWDKGVLLSIASYQHMFAMQDIVIGPTVYGLSLSATQRLLGIKKRGEVDAYLNSLDLPTEYPVATKDCICLYSGTARDDQVSFGYPVHFLAAYPKRMLMEIGGFDERYSKPGWDDNDFNKRLMLYGAQRAFTKQQAFHLYHYNNTPGYSPGSLTEENKKLFESVSHWKANDGVEWGQIRQ